MLDSQQQAQVLARLQHAAEKSELASQARTQASTLSNRLRAGVTIALLGPVQSGKTALLEVLLRQELPKPSATADALVVCGTGITADFTAAPPSDIEQITRSAPALSIARFVDVQGHQDPAVHAARSTWALSISDIVLWCGQGFVKDDLNIWSNAADPLKDHSFLVLTKADKLAEAGTLKTQLLGMQAVASEEFHSVFPTTALQARELLRTGQEVSDNALAASGVKALSAAVMQLAQSGQQADLDSALLFLERHQIPDVALSIGTDTQNSEYTDKNSYACALDLIRTSAEKMAADLDAEQDDIAETILTECTSVSEDLIALLEDVEAPSDSLSAWHDDIMDAGDKVVLMGLEGDIHSAADAVTIMLQLTREIEQRVYT